MRNYNEISTNDLIKTKDPINGRWTATALEVTTMSDARRGLPLTSSRIDKIFPKLTPAQIIRIAAHGHVRSVQSGEVLIEQGDTSTPLFAITSGEVEIVRPLRGQETLITVHGPGEFTGDVTTLSGRRSFARARATKPGEVIELDHQQMLGLVQTDAELGEILMRAFILRRAVLITAGVGDIVLIGSTYSADTLRIKEFLMRNGQPYSYIDLEHDPDVQNMLDSFHLAANEIPVVICRGQVVLRNPSKQEIADCLGFNESINQTQVRDLIIIGAGPSGLVRSLWRFRRSRCSGVGNRFTWWSGRFKFKNRKLLGISYRNLRSRSGRQGVCPGSKVRYRHTHC